MKTQTKKIPNKKLIFIDENGDTGMHPDSSKHFMIGALVVNHKGIEIVRKVFSDFRYWKPFVAEFKKVIYVDEINKTLNNVVLPSEHIQFYYTMINKKEYVGPYLREIKKTELDTHKFHNFVMRNLLEGIEEIKDETIEYEVVIDRYTSGQIFEKGLVEYLQDNHNLPKFESIVQVNSIYCEPIQIVDLIFRGIKNNVLKQELLREVRMGSSHKKEKGPDYPMGPVPNSPML